MKLNNKGFGTLGYVLIGCGVIALVGILIIGIGGYSLFKIGDTALKETYAYSVEDEKIGNELKELSSEAAKIKTKEQLVAVLNKQKNLKTKFVAISVSETIKPIVGSCRQVKMDILDSVADSAERMLVIVNSDTPNADEILKIAEENTNKVKEISTKGETVCNEYTAKVKEAAEYNQKLEELK
jgi:hypothetical protein